MTLFERFPILRNHPIFYGTDERTVERFFHAEAVRTQCFDSGTTVYSSEYGQGLVGFVLLGSAHVHAGGTKEPILLRTVGVGDLFGIANLYAETEPFPTKIIACEHCETAFFSGEHFRKFIESDPTALRNFLTLQSKKIIYLNRKILTFTAGSAEKKLAVFLLDHAVNRQVIPPCSMSCLSDMLGMGRASLYRAIDRLEAEGWIERKEKSFVIRNPDALMRFIS